MLIFTVPARKDQMAFYAVAWLVVPVLGGRLEDDLPRKLTFAASAMIMGLAERAGAHRNLKCGCRALPISERQRALYGHAINVHKHRNGGNAEKSIHSPLGLLSYLRALSSDPRPPGPLSANTQPLLELEQHSPKMRWMMSVLATIRKKDEKVIVFCEFKELQRTLQRAIAERFGFLADIINGDTTAAADRTDNRQRRIRVFQKTPGFGVIILSPLAVGFGVNVQAANHMIHYTRSWNPAREDQATDRAYRYPVVAEDFDTFDKKLDQLLEIKRKLSQDLEDTGGASLFETPISENEIPHEN